MLPYNIDHVAIVVNDLDAAIEEFRRQYQAEPISRETVPDQGVEEAMIAIGGSHIQLLAPIDDDSAVGRFLAKRGEGMHHVALAVPDIEAAIAHLKETGARMVDETPRTGGGGNRIAFVHPAAFAGTLIELVEVTE
jgi:methylmalonyl-CoA epimerase